ncbi:Ig-like domain repeat protein [Nocardioides terrisoli]|uniref:Ig-like domain repeat protein n=1 Tax=Nocardioides terrisoli TaxID=3388267 RepID=UPI00287BB8F2|nr:endonuclease/exonuclease/phosphatase family protein [Nocardioides marmorisolisilvae]
MACASVVVFSVNPAASAHKKPHRVHSHVHMYLEQTETRVGQPDTLTVTVSAKKHPVGEVRVVVAGKRLRTVELHGRQATVKLPSRLVAGTAEVRARYLGSYRVRPKTASVNWRVIPTVPSVPLRVGTYNIVDSSSTATFKSAVGSMLTHVDVLGLQEVNSKDKEKVMYNDFGDWSYVRDMIFVGGSRYPEHDYYYREDGAEQQPILWRTSRFDFESACKSLSAPQPLPGPNYLTADGMKSYRPDIKHWVQVVHLRDRESGQELSIINAHLLPGAVTNGHPRHGLSSHSWKLYTDQVRRLAHLVQAEKATGRAVLVMGDLNDAYTSDVDNGGAYGKSLPVRALRAKGMSSMWAIHRPARYGTRGKALLDHMFTNNGGPWVTSTTIYRSIKGSDHSPAMGVFRVPIGTPVPGDNTVRTPGAPPPVHDRDRNTPGPYKVTDNACSSDATY